MSFFSDIKIMGIVNVTPDSFYDGGRYNDLSKAVDHAMCLVRDGADILDIGGESTRPGAAPVSESEEMERVIPLIERLSAICDVTLSVDTNKSSVAEAALNAGASLVNDISAMTFDKGMARVISEKNAGVVLMHTSGRPDVMMHKTEYNNLVADIKSFLLERANYAQKCGIEKNKIIIDPGIGFGKTIEGNYNILSSLDEFISTDFPVLIGLSRKSLIAKLYKEDEDRLPATIALNTMALSKGAAIIRVHDVKEHKLALDALKMLRL
ncbi:MAG TPA: dihydropteroate synthase [Spirochaetota bacterium]|nr:dihydropteroate synthase [Spirochaetota bacterium]